MTNLTLRYASSDEDVVALHGFLCIMAGPTLPGTIDPKDSATEVWRTVTQDIAIMAMQGDLLVGTIGLICVASWWNHKVKYLANRWAFAIPGAKAWLPLVREAKKIGVASDMEVHLISELRGTVTILNRNKLRGRPL
jgi:hypothetical protein